MSKEELTTVKETDFKIMMPESRGAVDAVRDNLRGAKLSRFDLIAVKVPAGGELNWTIESPEGVELKESFDGIIVYWHDARSYYEDSENQSDDPPDCSSEDAIIGDPFGSCVKCQYSKWETAQKGRGQACRLGRILYILQPGSFLPTVLKCPPTSYQAIKKYFISLSANGISYSNVVTRFSLTPDQAESGHKYAKGVFKMVRSLNEDEFDFIKGYGETFKSSLNG